MRMRALPSLFATASLLLAAATQAGTLTSATWLQATEGVPMTRTTAQLGASGSSTANSVAVSLSYPQFGVSFFVPKTANGVLDLHVEITQGGPQAITATPAMAGGAPGIPGTVIIMTANHVAKGVNASMYNPGLLTLLRVPLSVGKAGQARDTITIAGQQHFLTVDFFAWTPGRLTFTGLSTMSATLSPLVVQGSFALSGMGGGTVTLVSPTKISINGALTRRRSVSLTTLKLTFVPEPGTLLLLAAAGAALIRAYGKTR